MKRSNILRLSVILLLPTLFVAVFSQTPGALFASDFDGTNNNCPLDNSGNQNTYATCTGVWQSGLPFCLSGGCFEFNQQQLITISPFNGLPSTQVAIEAWVYPKSFTQSNIVSHKWNTGTVGSYALELDPTGKISFSLRDPQGGQLNADSTLVLNQWQHVVGTYDGTKTRVYVDAVKGVDSTSVQGILLDSAGDMDIAGGAFGSGFDGLIDGVYIYPNTLPLADIYANFSKMDSDGDSILNGDESFDGDTDPSNDDTDSDGIPNYLDYDDDGDGIPASDEGTDDLDNDGLPNFADTDSDGDGVPDALEGTDDVDSDGDANYLDSDSDEDGTPDSLEPLLSYRFDKRYIDIAGTEIANDTSPYENHGLMNGASWVNLSVLGWDDGAYTFSNSAQDDISFNLLPQGTTGPVSEFTVETFVLFENFNEALPVEVHNPLVSNGDATNTGFMLGTQNRTPIFALAVGGGEGVLSTTAINEDEFYHLVGVFRANGESEIWVDGQKANSQAQTQSNLILSATDTYIGRTALDSTYLDGVVADAIIYPRALSSTEIVNAFDTYDSDGDGLTNKEEKIWGTEYKNRDTDNDGVSDGDEIESGTNPLSNILCSIATASINIPANFHVLAETNVTSSTTLTGGVNYAWTFAGSPTVHATDKSSANFTYSQMGKYNLTLNLNNGSLSSPEPGTCPLEVIETIDVVCPASVTIEPLEHSRYPVSTPMILKGSGTHLGGETVILGWDTNSDTVVDVTGDTLNISYPSTGKYNISLIGSGFTELCTAKETVQVTVDEGDPFVTLTSPGSGEISVGEKLLFSFEAFDLDGEIETWIWDFGERNLPWGTLGTSGNQPACFSNTNQAKFCVGANNIEWASSTFEDGADCTCTEESETIYPQSILEFDEDPGVLIHSYSSSDVCNDYDDDDQECEVSITVIDDNDLSATATITLEFDEEALFVCEDFVDNSVACSSGSDNHVLTSGTNNCCCQLGTVPTNSTLIDQTTGEQAVNCEVPLSGDTTDGIVGTDVTNPIVPTQPAQNQIFNSNVVTSQANQVEYSGQSILTQATGRTEEKGGLGGVFLTLIILVLLAAIIGGVFFLRKRSHHYSDDFGLPSISSPGAPTDYVQKARAQGTSDSQIRSSLKTKGWSETQIKDALRKP